MLVDVKVPVLSESVAEATLLSWHKKEGEHVDRDENLIDVETDKVVMELPAPAAGTPWDLLIDTVAGELRTIKPIPNANQVRITASTTSPAPIRPASTPSRAGTILTSSRAGASARSARCRRPSPRARST